MPKKSSKRNIKKIHLSSQKLGKQCIEEIKNSPLQCAVCFNSESKIRVIFSITMRKDYGKSLNFNLKSNLCEKCFVKLRQKFKLTKDLRDDPSGLNWDVKIDVIAIFGGFSDKRRNMTTSSEGDRRLVIKGIAIFGGGEIKSM